MLQFDPAAAEALVHTLSSFMALDLPTWASEALSELRAILGTKRVSVTYQAYLVLGIASITVMGFWILLNLLGFGAGTDAMDALDATEALEGADAADAVDAADAAEAADAGDSTASVFTFRSILAFLGGFGWSGVLAIEYGIAPMSSFLISIPAGLFFFFMTYGVLVFLLSMSASGSLNYHNAIGETGEVYLSVPPNRSGTGKVRVRVQGRLKTVSAYNASDQEAETNSRVKVIDQIDANTLLIKPLSEVDDDAPEAGGDGT